MRVTDLFDQKSGKPVISFEFSRPKTEKATANLEIALDKLVEAKPDYVSVTFGAGGSTREGSFELVEKLNSERGLPTVAYLAGVDLSTEQSRGLLEHGVAGLHFYTMNRWRSVTSILSTLREEGRL